MNSLLSDSLERGLNFSVPRLYILGGGKALATAVRHDSGEAALIQRCQSHKTRNCSGYLPEDHKAEVKRKLQNAYATVEYSDAKRLLQSLLRDLMHLNPSAARHLEEGLEETLTVHRLRVPPQLCRILSSSNVIESAFSIVERVFRNAKRCRPGDQIERWVASGLWVAEGQFRKVIGYRPILLAFMAEALAKKPQARAAAA